MEKTRDPIGENLRKTRESRGLSVSELEKILEIPKDRIYKWEQGKAAPQYEDRKKVESWINGTWNNIPKVEEPKSQYGGIDYSADLINVLKEQNEYLRKLLDTNLAGLSRDVNNNSMAIQAEIRGYGKYQILKQSNWNDQEFLKAMAVVDKIYGEELRVDDGQGNPRT